MTWHPDSCGCVLEFNSRNATADLIAVSVKCPEHASLTDAETSDACIEESQRKELTRQLVYDQVAKKTLSPEEKKTIALMLAVSGSNAAVPDEIWDPAIRFDWSFDVTRKLSVSLGGADDTQKQRIRDAAPSLKDHEIKVKYESVEIL